MYLLPKIFTSTSAEKIALFANVCEQYLLIFKYNKVKVKKFQCSDAEVPNQLHLSSPVCKQNELLILVEK